MTIEIDSELARLDSFSERDTLLPSLQGGGKIAETHKTRESAERRAKTFSSWLINGGLRTIYVVYSPGFFYDGWINSCFYVRDDILDMSPPEKLVAVYQNGRSVPLRPQMSETIG